MLVLTRHEGQRIIIDSSDGPIVLTLTKARAGVGRIGVDAPPSVPVNREEVREKNQREKAGK